MLKYIAVGPLHPYHDYAAGYYRPGAPNQFVALVGGCPSRQVAEAEARRLNKQAAGRQTAAFVEHNARGTTRGWYTDEQP